MRFGWFIAVWCSCVLPTIAQTFRAEVTPNPARTDRPVALTYTLEGGQPEQFIEPEFGAAFRVQGGPNYSSQTRIVNGRTSKSWSASYWLRIERPGTYTVPAAAVRTNDRTLRTEPIAFNVQPGVPTDELRDAGEHFVRLEVSADTAYPGQQLTLDYVLYTTARQLNYDFSQLPEPGNAYVRQVEAFNDQPFAAEIDGTPYTAKVIRREAVFPQQSGTLTLDPATVRLGVPTGRYVTRGFFRQPETVNLRLTTPRRRIPVLPFPDPPADFAGVAGEYVIDVRPDRRSLTTDESLRLRVAITGTGDPRRLEVPDLGLERDFEVYDPTLVDESIYERGGRVEGRKQFDYLLVPKRAGVVNLRPNLRYWSPDSLAYLTATTRIQRIQVAAGSGAATADVPLPAATPESRLFSEATLRPRTSWYPGSALFWMLTLLPLLLVSGTIGFDFYRRHQRLLGASESVSPVEQHLHAARAARAAGDTEAFYAALERLLDLESDGSEPALLELRQRIELARYAGYVPQSELAGDLRLVEALVA